MTGFEMTAEEYAETEQAERQKHDEKIKELEAQRRRKMTDEELIHHFAILREQQRCRDKTRPYSKQREQLNEICAGLEKKIDDAIKTRNQERQKKLEALQPDLGFDFTLNQEEN